MTITQMKSPNDLAQDRTSFAVLRTLMAADRRLMAWFRSARSMLSFGFTRYNVIDSLQGLEGFDRP